MLAPSVDRLEAAAGLEGLKETQEVVSVGLVPGIDHDLEHHRVGKLAEVEMPLA